MMTDPGQKWKRAQETASRRLEEKKITLGAYKAILAAARAEHDKAVSGKAASPSAPSPSKTTKPTPRAKRTKMPHDAAFSRPVVASISAADLAEAHAAIAEERGLRAAAARPDTFAHRVEAARALAEGREPRADLVEAPEQPDHKPMDPVKFAAAVRRVQKITEGK